MTKPIICGEEPFKTDQLYLYQNAIATYHLRLVPEPKISTTYEILCSIDDLELELTTAIDQWKEPYEIDILDIKLCTYKTAEWGGKIFFLRSFKVEIELIEMNNQEEDGDDILLPTFEHKTPFSRRKRLTTYKNFSP